LTGPEGDNATGRNADLFAGPRIPPFPRSLASHDEVSKSRDLDRFTLLKHRLQHIQDELHNVGRIILRDADLFEDLIRDVGFSHATSGNRFWVVSQEREKQGGMNPEKTDMNFA
jgi:hypothetical protein